MVVYGQEYTIRNVEINSNGESHNYRNYLQLDHEGFLWYSTYSGIVKDFGTHSTLSLFEGENKKILPKLIFGFFIDSKQRVWVSADTGIFVSNETLGNKFNRIEFKLVLQGSELQANSFIEGCDGNMWIIAADRVNNLILKVDPSFSVSKYSVPGIESRYTEDSYWLRNYLYFERIIDCSKLLVRQGRKLFVFEEGSTSLKANFTPTLNYERSKYLYPEWACNGGDGLLITDNGDLLPKSLKTSYTYNGQVFTTDYHKDWDIQILNVPFQEVIPISKSRNPDLKKYADLLTVDAFGKKILLFKMIEENDEFLLKKVEEITFPNDIGDIVVDRNGVIHVSGYDQIYKIKFNKNNFNKILNDFGNQKVDVQGFTELSKGEILVATNRGTFKLNCGDGSNGFEVDNIFPSLSVFNSLVKTNDSTVWGVGGSKGLWEINFLKNKTEEIHIFHSHWKLANLQYNDILKYSDSTLLLAGLFGLQEFNFQRNEFREVPIPVLENDREVLVNDIYTTEEKLYIGTAVQGLVIKDLTFNTFLHLNTDSDKAGLTLPSNKINTIFVDTEKNLWLGTDKGVVVLNKDLDKLEVINDANGLINLNVLGILGDAYENMWFSTLNGLYRYEKSTKRITSFYTEDGLTSNDFNPTACFKSSTNGLFFGGVNGLVNFDSISDTGQNQNVKIFPTKFEFYNSDKEREVAFDSISQIRYAFSLPHDHTSFSVSYTINDCYNTDTNKYVYQLEGLANDWVNLGDQTSLKLLSIPPGDYVLKIKGFNSSGIGSLNELRYPIHVAQVFYKRPWFIVLVAAIVVLGILLFIFRYIAKTRRRYALNLALVELERKTLISQMNPHFIFNTLNEIRNRLKSGKTQGLHNYVTLFSKLTRLTLDVTRNERIRLSRELDFIENYVGLYNIDNVHKVALTVECTNEISTEHLVIPPMILQPIIENAMVHGFTEKQSDKKIGIRIEKLQTSNQLTFHIQDNGRGIAASKEAKTSTQHVSYASQILRERLQLMNRINKRDKGYEITFADLGNGIATGCKVTVKVPYSTF
ncbi:MAG: histidine kinase [Bacteroidota bacterium]